ncbi:MAG: DMT family transporter, partial [Thermoleophilaceae bacterium]
MSVSTRRELRHEQETTHFAAVDWLMLIGVAVTWGASFLLIEVGLEHFAPTLVAFGRIAFGALALGAFPAARRPVPRGEWPLIAAMGVTWMAVPFVLFAVAQQWIDSSLAGMINAATPLFVAIVAAGAVRQLPTRMQAVGLIVGFAGVVAISLPSVGSGSNALGIVLVLLAAFLYGFA